MFPCLRTGNTVNGACQRNMVVFQLLNHIRKCSFAVMLSINIFVAGERPLCPATGCFGISFRLCSCEIKAPAKILPRLKKCVKSDIASHIPHIVPFSPLFAKCSTSPKWEFASSRFSATNASTVSFPVYFSKSPLSAA